MHTLLQDLQYAFRQFRKSPGSILTAVLSLALGIGATTAVFSVVYGVLLDPYPYKDADRMVHVELRDQSDRGPLLIVTGTEYDELRHVTTVDDVFLMDNHCLLYTSVLYTKQEFRDITLAPSWAGGLNDGRIRVPVEGLNSVTPELSRVLKHELTHSFVYQMSLEMCIRDSLCIWRDALRRAPFLDCIVQTIQPVVSLSRELCDRG